MLLVSLKKKEEEEKVMSLNYFLGYKIHYTIYYFMFALLCKY